jgi:nitroimidazol reductase NimA-like FMN-containing flavoprotein (pyridoxamine 5'-phosphate oxidase superfamily)
MKYHSVIGFGTARFVEGIAAKRQALDLITAHYSGDPQDYAAELVEKVAIIQVDVDQVTGKRSEV